MNELKLSELPKRTAAFFEIFTKRVKQKNALKERSINFFLMGETTYGCRKASKKQKLMSLCKTSVPRGEYIQQLTLNIRPSSGMPHGWRMHVFFLTG